MTNIDLITDPETDLMGRAAKLGEEIKGLFIDAMPQRDSASATCAATA